MNTLTVGIPLWTHDRLTHRYGGTRVTKKMLRTALAEGLVEPEFSSDRGYLTIAEAVTHRIECLIVRSKLGTLVAVIYLIDGQVDVQ